MTLTDWKDTATIIGVIIAAGTLVKGVIEYGLQGSQKRTEQFLLQRRRFKENPRFVEIMALIEHGDAALTQVTFKDKRELLGFFEEIALMVYSGLMRPRVAHYMFGYYAIQCWESDAFWVGADGREGVNKRSAYWSLFARFVKDMQVLQDELMAAGVVNVRSMKL